MGKGKTRRTHAILVLLLLVLFRCKPFYRERDGICSILYAGRYAGQEIVQAKAPSAAVGHIRALLHKVRYQ